MNSASRRSRRVVVMILLVLVAVSAAMVVRGLVRHEPGDPRLARYVAGRPTVPIVFTSRSEPSAFTAPAPEAEGFTDTGRGPWSAAEGRLRLLTPDGTVHELTWGRPLPDGDTLVDVISPSVTPDGRRILFAGRRSADPLGRFRIYEIGMDGRGLRPRTGGPDDEGCTAVPPMRFHADGRPMADSDRRRIDYDDLDPIELNLPGRPIVFVSSRTPDLGRDHARRSTTLWWMDAQGARSPLSANRNNDRWPYLLRSRYIAFSMWSRNREVVSADGFDIRPTDDARPGLTRPTDLWQSAFVQIPGGHFGMLLKPGVPVWRPRPLFSGKIAFMTTADRSAPTVDQPPLTIAVADPGWIEQSPSTQGSDAPLPHRQPPPLRYGTDRTDEGRTIRSATPSACPPDHIVFSAAPLEPDGTEPRHGAFGIYLSRDPSAAGSTRPELLFDDPDLVDAEPCAVYVRDLGAAPPIGAATGEPKETVIPRADGRTYRGPAGSLFATGLDGRTTMTELPGQKTDTGAKPIFDNPPDGAIDHLRIYAAYRDRFDDPVRPRIPGSWELLLKVPVKGGAGGVSVPIDVPTMLAGFDRHGKIVRWQSAPRDSAGTAARFYAFAGDHYSAARPNARAFCVGCHPGHSGLPPEAHLHAERIK